MVEDGFLLTNGDNSVRISPNGTNIAELILDGRKILTTVTRGDGKVAMTHPCTPVFGSDKEPFPNLKQHGDMRNSPVKPTALWNRTADFKYEVSDETYPAGLEVTRQFRLDPDGLRLYTIHKNTSQQPLPVFYGEHPYFYSPEGIDNIKLNGAQLRPFLDSLVPNWKNRNILEVPGLPKLTLIQSELRFAYFWVGQNNGKIDEGYACIEPLMADPNTNFFNTRRSLIDPGAQKTSYFIIKLA